MAEYKHIQELNGKLPSGFEAKRTKESRIEAGFRTNYHDKFGITILTVKDSIPVASLNSVKETIHFVHKLSHGFTVETLRQKAKDLDYKVRVKKRFSDSLIKSVYVTDLTGDGGEGLYFHNIKDAMDFMDDGFRFF